MLLLSVCVVLAAAAAGVNAAPAAPAGTVPAKVQPPRASVYLKNVLELRLQAAAVASASQCLVRGPSQGGKFVDLKDPGAQLGRLSLLGDCGVRVRDVTAADAGTWTLSAKYDDGTATAEAAVIVKDFGASVLPELPSVNEGATLRLHLAAGAKMQPLRSCAVLTPKGDAVQLAPDAKEGRVQYDAEGGSLAGGWCGLKVGQVQARDGGAWLLEAVALADGADGPVYRGKTSVSVFLPEIAMLPPGPMYVEVGDEATLTMQLAKAPAQDPNWKVCSVKKPDGSVVRVAGEDAVDQDAAVALVELAKGRCVVRVTLSSKAASGFWTLSAGPDKDSLRTGKVRIFVKEPYVPVGGTVQAAVGSTLVLLRCGPQSDDVLACDLKDPSGRLAATLAGPCSLRLDRVRADHRGNWTCSVALRGYTQAAGDYVQLDLDEPAHADTAATWDNGAATLKCVVSGCGHGADYCRMVGPDGSSVVLKEAVTRQGEYAYAGAGFAQCDCSMRIAAPRDQHLGVWRCYVGGRDSRALGGLIHLEKQEKPGRPARSRALDVVPFTVPATGLVRPGSVMTVGCRAPRALSYCYLRTPRTPLGEQLLLSEHYPVHGVYAGDGLAFGDCAVRMAMAANHSGTWHCGVGVVHGDGPVPGMDLEVPVQVTVSDSLVVPVETNVTASLGSAATLACRTALGEAIQYCRFHRPDGSSIHLADAQSADTSTGVEIPYQYAGGGAGGAAGGAAGRALRDGYCGVNISLVRDVDVGPWTCVVALVGDAFSTEHTATLALQLRQSDAAAGVDAALTGMAAALAAAVLAGAAFLVYRRYYRRPRHPASAESIPLGDAQSVASSPGVTRTRTMTTRALGATMQTSHLPARTRTRSARRGSRAEAASSNLSDSSQDVESEQSPHTARKSQ